MKHSNLTLIGMPASGKSTVGVILAKVIGYDFLDTDLLIQKKTGKKLRELIAEQGIDGFLKIENEVLAGVRADRCVIATGGSAVYGEEGMRHLCDLGKIIYLETEFQVIERRLRNIRRRGVVIRKGQTLLDLYRERTPLYERYADLVIHEERGDSEAVVQKILGALTV